MKYPLVFFGTPEFAASSLNKLIEDDRFEILAVVTQEDKPVGRGQHLTPPAVKVLAQKHDIPVLQPTTLKGFELSQFIKNGEPIILVVVAYGKIIPEALLKSVKFGAVNVHASLLPRWRGAAPIHRALLAGDADTGVCIMQLEKGLDTGPVYERGVIPILEDDTLQTLHDKLAELGAELLVNTLPAICSGALLPVAQSGEGITYAEKWNKEESNIRFEESAEIVLRRIRISAGKALYKGENVKIVSAKVGSKRDSRPGEVIAVNREEIWIGCGEGTSLIVTEMQFAGKKKLSVREIFQGREILQGDTFGNG